MPSIKRNASSEPDGSARKRTAGSSRTGQACDRCKVRKIRCDATPGGCTPCMQNGTECRTTDRITGRATSRGHTETLENENTSLKMYVIELQAQLRQNGMEPGPPPAIAPGYAPPQIPYSAPYDGQQSNGYGQSGNTERHGSQGSLLPEFRTGCIGDNYLGVASENNWLSPIEGTSLALFGTKIDLAEFVPPEPNPDASPTSYQTFLSHAFGHSQPAPRPDLPSYEDCKMYAEFYFRSVQQFIPILHKPTFMNLLVRIYHEGHQTSPAEEVMVHMLLAVMFFQWSARNPAGSDEFSTSSFSHYHYALSFVPQLIKGHELEDVQALALICSQLRNQPRPGAAWMFTNMVLGLAIELGLHRSARAWPDAAGVKDPHTIEMRKRVFWSLMVFHVTISGKLGRPMPLRFEDFDIEIPDAIYDNLPTESSLPKWKKCSFRAGIQGFKILKIMMQVYSTIYSIKSSTGPYEVNVRQLEKELQAFQSQLPPELAGGSQTRDEDRAPALYLQLTEAECQLLLHHPSLNRSNSPQTASTNLDICLEASNKMLTAATHLKQLKSLDTTWYYATDFLAAIFTTLFAYTEKRDQVTQDTVQQLRQDMESWLDIMGEVGKLLGTGPKLQEATRNIVEYSLSHINRHLTEKTASAAMATVPSGPEQSQQQQTYAGQDYYAPTTNGTNHFAYPEPQSMPQYNATAYDTSAYNAEGMRSNIEAQLNAELGPQAVQHQTPQPHSHQQMTPQPHQITPQPQQAPSNFMTAFQQTPTGTPQTANGFPPAQAPMQAAFPHSGPAAWRHFADNMMTNLVVGGHDPDQQQHLHHALPTHTVNGSLATAGGGGPMAAAATFGGMQMPADGTQSWPHIQYGGFGGGVPGQGGE
ncbi:hypothetical protein LTR85_003523 [Meristemomyces frigidus]|nr:hypothetical protein LTR85_003523 [Meristemomyces frigidus]